MALRDSQEGRCIPNYAFVHHSNHFTHQIAIDSVLSDLGLQTGKRCSNEDLLFNTLCALAHVPQKCIPSFCRKIIWYTNILSVWYILSEMELEMSRDNDRNRTKWFDTHGGLN